MRDARRKEEMKKVHTLLMAFLQSASMLLPAYSLPLQAAEQTEEIQPVLPASLQDEYTLYEPLSDEFNGQYMRFSHSFH